MTIRILIGAVLALVALTQPAAGQVLVRGPYLQDTRPDSVTLRWRTDIETPTLVQYGGDPAALDQSVSVAGVRTEHVVTITALTPATTQYYSVGTDTTVLAGADSDHFFVTAPLAGDIKNTRIWILGDSGTADGNAEDVREAYLSFTDTRGTDLMLMLGDNAYPDGTDAEYQAALFDIYPTVIRNTPLWSTLGNHDGASANSATNTGPYFDIFSLPGHGLAGGLASGTEAYYSFDYANIHFVCLDSHQSDRSPGSAMLTWLENDLAATQQDWIIAFWHHPPYSKGSHDSDTEDRLIEMRANAVPILEDYGVDLILGGHSHSYERSFLLDGYYGDSGSLTPGVLRDSGDGSEAGTGAYRKPSDDLSYHDGTVFTVAGSSGKISGGLLNHPAMFVSLNRLGSVVLDVDGLRLDATFVQSDGSIGDQYTIIKEADLTPPALAAVSALDANTVRITMSEAIVPSTAEDTGNYQIEGIAVTGALQQPAVAEIQLTTAELIEGISYTVTVSGLADPVGNAMTEPASADFVWLQGQEIGFQNAVSPDGSYAGTVDTYLAEATPDVNFGAELTLRADSDDPGGTGQDLVALLRWDISSLPAAAIVQSAEITLVVSNPTNSVVDVFPLLRDWDVATVTWTDAATGLPWETPGAAGVTDRGIESLASFSAGQSSAVSVLLDAAGIAIVQSWIDGGDNFGVALVNSGNDGLAVASSDAVDTQLRPRLTVGYLVPPIDSDADGMPDYADNCSEIANPLQRDTNQDGFGNRCDTDLNNDCVSNPVDLGLLRANYFASGPDLDEDFDGDGAVNPVDLGILSSYYFAPPGPSGRANCEQ